MNFDLESLILAASAICTLLNIFILYRISVFENRFLEKLNGRYLTRKETDLILKDRDQWRADVSKKFDHVWDRIRDDNEKVHRLRNLMTAALFKLGLREEEPD